MLRSRSPYAFPLSTVQIGTTASTGTASRQSRTSHSRSRVMRFEGRFGHGRRPFPFPFTPLARPSSCRFAGAGSRCTTPPERDQLPPQPRSNLPGRRLAFPPTRGAASEERLVEYHPANHLPGRRTAHLGGVARSSTPDQFS